MRQCGLFLYYNLKARAIVQAAPPATIVQPNRARVTTYQAPVVLPMPTAERWIDGAGLTMPSARSHRTYPAASASPQTKREPLAETGVAPGRVDVRLLLSRFRCIDLIDRCGGQGVEKGCHFEVAPGN
jgi:hypothetical protein